jgi:hypothetical protein
VAVGRAERGLAEPRHEAKELEKEVGGEVLVDERRVGGEPAEVCARAEGLVARARQHDGPHVAVVSNAPHRVDQLGQQLPVERVALVGAVERDRGDAVGDVVKERFVVGRHSRKYDFILYA